MFWFVSGAKTGGLWVLFWFVSGAKTGGLWVLLATPLVSQCRENTILLGVLLLYRDVGDRLPTTSSILEHSMWLSILVDDKLFSQPTADWCPCLRYLISVSTSWQSCRSLKTTHLKYINTTTYIPFLSVTIHTHVIQYFYYYTTNHTIMHAKYLIHTTIHFLYITTTTNVTSISNTATYSHSTRTNHLTNSG